jgi:hypothetical protein
MKSVLSSRRVRLLAVAGVLALAGGIARADTKSYPGSVCQPIWGPENVQGQGLFHENPGIRNSASSSRLVLCPLERDNTGNGNGLLDLSLGAAVTTGPITCVALSFSQLGSVIKSVFQQSSGNNVNTTISFSSTLNQSSNLGVYDLQCELPSGAAILSINYNEP